MTARYAENNITAQYDQKAAKHFKRAGEIARAADLATSLGEQLRLRKQQAAENQKGISTLELAISASGKTRKRR